MNLKQEQEYEYRRATETWEAIWIIAGKLKLSTDEVYQIISPGAAGFLLSDSAAYLSMFYRELMTFSSIDMYKMPDSFVQTIFREKKWPILGNTSESETFLESMSKGIEGLKYAMTRISGESYECMGT